MLNHLEIRNFTLVDRVEIAFNSGSTAITGETGAGKSILLNALGSTLGDRADASRVRPGSDRAEVVAEFNISANPDARAWLERQAMEAGDQLLLRRVILADGGSRAWINGTAVTAGQLRELAEMLINIHSQHEHQGLVRRDVQRELLDRYGDCEELVAKVGSHWRAWQQAVAALKAYRDNEATLIERRDLLRFQVDELEALDLQSGEFGELEAEQKLLANAEAILQTINQLTYLLGDAEEFNLQSALAKATQFAEGLPDEPADFGEIRELLANATIQVDEAQQSLRRCADRVRHDPERLADVETRIGTAFQLARKHRCQPGELPDLLERLRRELAPLQADGDPADRLAEDELRAREQLVAAAGELSNRRQRAARQLAEQVNARFTSLGMAGAELQIELAAEDPVGRHGAESVEFRIRTNPGMPHKPIARIASGGELSRIGLAIQVVAAQGASTPTLVFDEVDAGIGGSTAAVVGQMLAELGRRVQVICITHLPQVACAADWQLRVEKSSTGESAETQIVPLDETRRVEEIARMLGGLDVTETTRRNARELLETRPD